MSLSKSIKNLKTDKRLYTLNTKMGEIDPKSHQDYLASLEDVSDKSKKLVDTESDMQEDDVSTDMN